MGPELSISKIVVSLTGFNIKKRIEWWRYRSGATKRVLAKAKNPLRAVQEDTTDGGRQLTTKGEHSRLEGKPEIHLRNEAEGRSRIEDTQSIRAGTIRGNLE